MSQDQATTAPPVTPQGNPQVEHFRQILLWPLRLMPVRGSEGRHAKPWELLAAMGDRSPWQEVVDEYNGSASAFHERHYNEFVTFLPYVQRFLFGEGRRLNAQTGAVGSPMRVFRRHDVAQVRATTRFGTEPLLLNIVHVDLYFFLDLDLVLLNVEVSADHLSLDQAQDLLHRFGRGYPAGWDPEGNALHCLASAEWLAADGTVLAKSDAHNRDAFMSFVSTHRAPRLSAHWAWLLNPLVSDHSEQEGPLRYRQIEYYRMPVMGYLAMQDPRKLTRNDFVRLGLVTGMAAEPSSAEVGYDTDDADGGNLNSHIYSNADSPCAPYAESHLKSFEQQYCYDRFWTDGGAAPRTRYLASGHSLVVVGDARSQFFGCRDRGVLAQFRHQHFLVFLIAHFQKAALLMFSDRLAEALKNLNITDPISIRSFKRTIRGCFSSFLRFTHRYWFHEVSEQAHVRTLFKMTTGHLGVDPLYDEVKERIAEMNSYLEADSLRRQANTVVRLTVVTIFGLVGTVTTGFLGMNLLAESDASMTRRLVIFAITFILTTVLTIYTMMKSKRLSDFLDVLSDERTNVWHKGKALMAVWRSPPE